MAARCWKSLRADPGVLGMRKGEEKWESGKAKPISAIVSQLEGRNPFISPWEIGGWIRVGSC